MRNLIVVAILLSVGWYAYGRYQARVVPAEPPVSTALPVARQSAPSFRCDGRTRCSQMTSCEEAAFYLKNCPGTKMDGDGDGVPCETQWCR
jgi:hypothetical protein